MRGARQAGVARPTRGSPRSPTARRTPPCSPNSSPPRWPGTTAVRWSARCTPTTCRARSSNPVDTGAPRSAGAAQRHARRARAPVVGPRARAAPAGPLLGHADIAGPARAEARRAHRRDPRRAGPRRPRTSPHSAPTAPSGPAARRPPVRRRTGDPARGSTAPRRGSACERPAGRGDGQPVDEVVHRVARMALHPTELRLPFQHQLDERHPQIGVGHRLLLRVLPPVRAATSRTSGRGSSARRRWSR